MATVTIGGGRHIHYDDIGSGPALVTITGIGQPRWTATEWISAFSPTYRIVAIDNRDGGDSEPESEPYTIADLADDVAGLMQALGIERAHILGESAGGMIAQELTLQHPETVDRLVLISSAPAGLSGDAAAGLVPLQEHWIDDPVERWRAVLPRACAPGFFDSHPDLLDQLAETFRGNRHTWEGRTRQVGAQAGFDARDRLDQIVAPTIILHGDQDPLLPPSGAETMANGIPDARIIVFAGAGHVLRTERLDEASREIRAFLAAE